MKLTDVKKRAIFRDLASKSQYQVGVEYGLDKYARGNIGMVNIVNKVYREVKENWDKFALTQEVVELVEKGMAERRGKKSDVVRFQDIGEVNERDLITGVKRKAWLLLNRKLDYLSKNRSAFYKESSVALAKIAGIVFDKAQIMKGEATEHIAIYAKVSQNITSDEAMKEIMKIREVNVSNE